MYESAWVRETLAKVRHDPPHVVVPQAFDPRFRRYLHPASVVAWLERAEAFLSTQPQDGREMALRAPELLERASRERGLKEPELELRAWTVRGSMLRILGDLSAAEKAFRCAVRLGRPELAESPELAWMFSCYSLVKVMAGYDADALALVERGLALLRETSDPRVNSCDRL